MITDSATEVIEMPPTAAQWCEVLDPQRDDWYWRCIGGRAQVENLVGSYSTCAADLNRLNQAGYGIYATVQRSTGRSSKDVTEVVALMADLDSAPLDPALQDLEPHMVVETSPNRYQVFWLVEGLDPAKFKALQRVINQRYGADMFNDNYGGRFGDNYLGRLEG